MRQRDSVGWELARASLHAGVGFLIVLLSQAQYLTVPVFGLIVILFSAVVFYNFNQERELLSRILSLDRPDIQVPGLDLLFYFLGTWLVLWIFGPPIAYAAIMILAFGDSVAHMVSHSFGGTQTYVTKKTYWQGTVAGIIVSVLVAIVYVPFVPALAAGIIAMLLQAGELRIGSHHIDDNLTIPLVAGVVLWLFSQVL